jgi:mono/diheme cytochrome c family protein
MKKVIIIIVLIFPFVLSLSGQTKNKITSAKTPAPANTPTIKRGSAIYNQYCAACHQASGDGVPGLNPPLSKTEYVLGNKTNLINILLKGLNEELEIDGEIFSNLMPPLNYLTDQQIADVLSYVRNNFQNKASIVTQTEVKAVRAKK